MLSEVTRRHGGQKPWGWSQTKVTCALYPEQSLPCEQPWMTEIFVDSQAFQALRKKNKNHQVS